MGDEEWVKVATVDDTVVAELLVTLKQLTNLQAPPPPQPASKPALSLEWSVRQRRSKAVVVQAKKQAPRASPTTPLSWSGGTSVSGGGGASFDGGAEEESGRPSPPKRSDASRSKVIGTSEATTSKKSRRKKTLAELKEEEDLLVKERRQLKRELAIARHKLEKERARNENFKRIKIDMHQLVAVKIDRTTTSELGVSEQQQPKIESVLLSPPVSTCTEANKEVGLDKFVLPDLNIPFEENSSCDMVCGVR